MAITRGPGVIYKLAADSKPTASLEVAGIKLKNTDDHKKWINSGSDWIPLEFIDYKRFNVLKEGSNHYITDLNDRVVQGPSTDVADIVSDHMLTQGVTAVWEYVWDATPFTVFQPVIIPPTVTGIKKYVHQAQGIVAKRLISPSQTSLIADASFPTNRYFFELNNPTLTTSNTGYCRIDGFSGVNNTNFQTINVGLVKFEGGDNSNGQENWVVSNCHSNYLWRNIHLIGKVWHGRFDNNTFTADNAAFSGDCDILLEDGGHTGSTNTTPKDNTFFNNRNMHSEGTQVNSIRIQSGGYNNFLVYFIDGWKCSDSIISLNNTDGYSIHNNNFNNITALDMQTTSPDNREAGIHIAGTSAFDNVFRQIRMPAYPETVLIEGAGAVRNDLEIAAFWGVTSRVTDTGTDGTNTIRVIAGGKASGADTPIVHTGGVSKIKDDRRGAANGGSSFFSGNGSTTAFNIPHGLFRTPAWVIVGKGQAPMLGNDFYWTWDATNITVVFQTPPSTGTNNITLRWRAEAYA